MADTRPSTTVESADAADAAADLARLRAAIDEVDRQILERLNDRARLVQQVGELKRAHRAPVYAAGRERDIVARLSKANPGPFPSAGLPHVFREIISATRSLEEVVRVAFLGPAGTFSHQAAVRQFGALVELHPCTTIPEVIAATESGAAHYGVIPVENTTEGAVTQTLDALVESEVTVCGELLLDVHEQLLSRSGELARIRVVASHPQPLAQCREWLDRHLPGVERRETASTAAAAALAARDEDVGAVASEIAAEAYGLRVVSADIEDRRGNTTRFFVIGQETPAPSGDDLVSVVYTIRKDQSGALHHLLEPFARHHVNLTAIQSRPMKGKPWEYVFFFDLEGHASAENVRRALQEAAERASSYKVLGSFPRGQRARRAGRRA